MKNSQTKTLDALQHVDPQRRGFLAKLLAGGAALPVMSAVALGDEGDAEGKGKGGKGKGFEGKGFEGKGFEGKGFEGKGKGEMRDPAEVASRLIEEFDKDGDDALNAEELTAALRLMRARRARAKGKGGPGKGKGKGIGGPDA